MERLPLFEASLQRVANNNCPFVGAELSGAPKFLSPVPLLLGSAEVNNHLIWSENQKKSPRNGFAFAKPLSADPICSFQESF